MTEKHQKEPHPLSDHGKGFKLGAVMLPVTHSKECFDAFVVVKEAKKKFDEALKALRDAQSKADIARKGCPRCIAKSHLTKGGHRK